MSTISSQVSVQIGSGFDDPLCSVSNWSDLLEQGETDAVNLTWHWSRCWWQARGRGRFIPIAARRAGQLVALAPLFIEAGMVFNLCPEDQLDFVGDVSDPEILDAILEAARARTEGFLGYRFYFIPDSSRTGQRLQAAAQRLGLDCFCETQLASPWLDMENQRDVAERCTLKHSLVRHERRLSREGELRFDVLCEASEVSSELEHFFEQHITRRATTPARSLFSEPDQREYYRRLTEVVAAQGWLRFARLAWKGQPIAYHYGLYYRGRYLWGIPTFDIQLARYSPGEVLLRHVLLDALKIGAQKFDFGPGEEVYKYRFATGVVQLQTWGLYPRDQPGA